MDYAVIDETFQMAIAGPLADKNNEQLMGSASGKHSSSAGSQLPLYEVNRRFKPLSAS